MVKIYLFLFVLPVLVLSTYGHPIQLEHLNLTAKIYSPCASLIKTCPQTYDSKNGRMLCMFLQLSCPTDNFFYFCDIDSHTGVLVEDCFPRHTCDAGTKNAVRLDLKPIRITASLVCVQCSEYRVQRQTHDSSQRFISECDDSRITIDFNNMLPTMTLVAKRWPSGFDIYACDSTRGYSNEYKSSLCDTSSVCSCRTDIKCTDLDRPILLPNGQCDAVCDKERDPFKDFSCPSHSTDLNTANIPETKLSTNQSTTYQPPPKQNSSSMGPVGTVFVCLIGIIAVGIVVVVVLYCCCLEKIQCLVKRARAGVLSRTDTDAKDTLAEDPTEDEVFLGAQDESVEDGESDAANGNKQGKTINKETNGEKIEINGKNITYEIHHHYQLKPDTQQEHKLTEDTSLDSDGYPEQAMQYYPSNQIEHQQIQQQMFNYDN